MAGQGCPSGRYFRLVLMIQIVRSCHIEGSLSDAVDCPTMRARIHRGAADVGGNCVELDAGGTRLVLDVAWPIR